MGKITVKLYYTTISMKLGPTVKDPPTTPGSETERDDDEMPILIQVALATSLWCFFHSLFITHKWRDMIRRLLPRHHLLNRLVYVGFSSVSFGLMAWWFFGLPARELWNWPGWCERAI